jgi:hypothetical protein
MPQNGCWKKSLKTLITTDVILCVNEPLNFYTEYSQINKERKNSSQPRIKEINGRG